jgi:transcription elongation factor GreA
VPTPLEDIIARLEAEKKQLEYEFKVELPKAIGVARAHGDLSENAEYHAAREKHAFVRARIGQVDAQLARLKSVDLRHIPKDRVGLYARVRLMDADSGTEVLYQLVTSEEANAEAGLISVSSPIGRGLTGKREGDEVKIQVPSGTRCFEILAVITVHDQD